MWEAGRVNFTVRRFSMARRLMLGAFRLEPTPRRLAYLDAAVFQLMTNWPTLSRLRFRGADAIPFRRRESQFLFEKKNQKTFTQFDTCCSYRPLYQKNKSFLFLFFKREILPCFVSVYAAALNSL